MVMGSYHTWMLMIAVQSLVDDLARPVLVAFAVIMLTIMGLTFFIPVSFLPELSILLYAFLCDSCQPTPLPVKKYFSVALDGPRFAMNYIAIILTFYEYVGIYLIPPTSRYILEHATSIKDANQCRFLVMCNGCFNWASYN